MNLEQYLNALTLPGVRWIAKRLSGNDTGLTGGHQSGVYLPETFFEVIFPTINTITSENPRVSLCATFPQSGYVCSPSAIYYNSKPRGTGTRDEFRITGWGGAKCPLLQVENTGALTVMRCEEMSDGMLISVWVAQGDEDEKIEAFLGVAVSPGEFADNFSERETSDVGKAFPAGWSETFPSPAEIFAHVVELVPWGGVGKADKTLMRRREREFEIFSALEAIHITPLIRQGFGSVENFLLTANSVTNRRKARSGRSLELHLADIFTWSGVRFDSQCETERGNRPDFIFPGAEAYHDPDFPVMRLRMLAAKTCCKDRWRQVLREADRIPCRHLLTLQQGVSENQIAQMRMERLGLVVPSPLHHSYPECVRAELRTLSGFIGEVLALQN